MISCFGELNDFCERLPVDTASIVCSVKMIGMVVTVHRAADVPTLRGSDLIQALNDV
jgi:hypothetical protein